MSSKELLLCLQQIRNALQLLEILVDALIEKLMMEAGDCPDESHPVDRQIREQLRLYRATDPTERLKIGSPMDAANLLRQVFGISGGAQGALGEREVVHALANSLVVMCGDLCQEVLLVVLLDTKNNVMAVERLYKGSLNSSVVRVAEVFRDAIRANAAAILIAHNHPSGDPTPSPEDVRVTQSIVEAGRLLEIKVLDHLVIGQNRWVSLRERGLGGFI